MKTVSYLNGAVEATEILSGSSTTFQFVARSKNLMMTRDEAQCEDHAIN